VVDTRFYIPLYNGQLTVVDELDKDLAEYGWSILNSPTTSYARRDEHINGKRHHILMHRVILERVLGRPLQSGEVVDHIDNVGLNNVRSNLRLATRQQNVQHRGVQSNSTTGLRGVTPVPNTQGIRYKARIRVNGEIVQLGTFDTAELASAAYEEKAKQIHGEFYRASK
jgi:hypothetical protein